MIRGANTFDVFVRNWWRWEVCQYRGRYKVPHAVAPRRYLARGVSYDEARALCERYAATHRPGPLSRKAEFESAS